MRKQRETAFTLVELLVVIAIVALAAGLLFPSFSSAKLSGRHAEHVSNLRQLSLAWSMYSDSYDDSGPTVAKLWATKSVDRRLFVSQCDPYPLGWAHPFPEFVLAVTSGFDFREKVSILDHSEFSGSAWASGQAMNALEALPAWAVIPGCDATRLYKLRTAPPSDASWFVGSFSRLNKDGSVIRHSISQDAKFVSSSIYFGGEKTNSHD